MNKHTVTILWILLPALIITMYFVPTGHVVSTPGELILAHSVLEPPLVESNIRIVTENIRARIVSWPGVSRVNANIYMIAQARLNPEEKITSTKKYRAQASYYEILAQEESQARIIPLVVALNQVNQSYWIDGEGVYVLRAQNSSRLQEADIIVAANGQAVHNLQELTRIDYLEEELNLILLRDNKQETIRDADIQQEIFVTHNPTLHSSTLLQISDNRPYMGRSADLSTALSAYEILTDPLTNCTVAATGTLEPDGDINEVLQVHTKIMRSQELDAILIPQKNYEELDQTYEHTIIPVQNFQQAIQEIRAITC